MLLASFVTPSPHLAWLGHSQCHRSRQRPTMFLAMNGEVQARAQWLAKLNMPELDATPQASANHSAELPSAPPAAPTTPSAAADDDAARAAWLAELDLPSWAALPAFAPPTPSRSETFGAGLITGSDATGGSTNKRWEAPADLVASRHARGDRNTVVESMDVFMLPFSMARAPPAIGAAPGRANADK